MIFKDAVKNKIRFSITGYDENLEEMRDKQDKLETKNSSVKTDQPSDVEAYGWNVANDVRTK
jgi:hypothetical protein